MQKKIFHSFFNQLEGEAFTVAFWDGENRSYGSPGTEPGFRLILNERLDLPALLSNPEIKLGEAYMEGKIHVEGELRSLFRLAIKNRISGDKKGLLQRFMERQKKTSRAEQEEGVKQHYDLGNDFFRLWLDETMSYSCTYFRHETDTLKIAQVQKNQHILKKLNLKEGQKILDIGSGWGYLIIQAAKEYRVRALGLTLSEEQAEKTHQRIKEEGLEGQVEVRLADYRDLSEEGLTFHRIVSVGMFEHVGKEQIPLFFESIHRMLPAGGLSLLHTITYPQEDPSNPWLEKYIFPWGYIPSLREVVWELPQHDFYLLDLESLRRHYALTTDHWARNFEEVKEVVKKEYGERFVRMWCLFLTGCTVSFCCTGLDIHQLLFSKGLNNTLPLTREYMYRDLP